MVVRMLALLALASGVMMDAAGAASTVSAASRAYASDEALDRRVTALTQELRCLVCQNQTIADSQAPLALELRQRVREQLAQGATEHDVIDFMVQRYGDFVLYRPPLAPRTWLLWFGPAALACIGLLLLAAVLRRHRPQAPVLAKTQAQLHAELHP